MAILAYIFVHADLLFVIPIMLVVLFLGLLNYFVGRLVRIYGEKHDVNMRSAG